MRWGTDWPARHDMKTLRLLGSVGEPINPEAWMWYYEHIGGGRCPVVDTWWQTETGQILIAPLPGITPMKPGSATRPFPGIAAEIVDGQGENVVGERGLDALTLLTRAAGEGDRDAKRRGGGGARPRQRTQDGGCGTPALGGQCSFWLAPSPSSVCLMTSPGGMWPSATS